MYSAAQQRYIENSMYLGCYKQQDYHVMLKYIRYITLTLTNSHDIDYMFCFKVVLETCRYYFVLKYIITQFFNDLEFSIFCNISPKKMF